MKPKTSTPYKAEDGTWRIDNVPMCATGVEYRLKKGPVTFTEADLADAFAAQADPAVPTPRIKLGHTSGFNDALIGDGEPAFGRWDNLVLADNGQTIYGDMVGMPEWLAKIAPTAYPGRSIDGMQDAETVTGKKYKLLITDCSLLGVKWPGVSILEDLPLWYGAEVPAEAEIVASGGSVKNPFKSKKDLEAAVDVSIIRRKFYNDGPGKNNADWWIRGERFDSTNGYQLIVDQGNGDLSRVPVAVDGADITYGDPVMVTEEFPDKAVAASAVLAGMATVDPDMVIYASRADTESERPKSATQEGAGMDEETRSKLASKLGLPEDATEEQIRTKQDEVTLAAAEKTPEEIAAEATAKEKAEADAKAKAEADAKAKTEPTVIKNDDGAEVVQLDRAAYEELQTGARLAASHEQDRKSERITSLIEAAIGDGRIPPARREHWTKALAADFDGSAQVLAGLEKGMIPVGARGTSGNSDEGVQAGQGEGLPDSWFPEIATIRAEHERGPRRVVNAKEG